MRFAGGLQIVTPPGHRLHGLSDLKLVGGDLLAVTDAGDLVRATLVPDRRGRPARLSNVRLRPLTGLDGQPFPTKSDGDAEGLAIGATEMLLVSFEQQPRLWSYGRLNALQARPTPWAVPSVAAGNSGLEALATADAGAVRVAAESGGIWDCTPDACRERAAPPLQPIAVSDWRITGMDRDPRGEGWFVVERRYREPLDMRARIRRMDAAGALGPVLVELGLPSTTDNFEGMAAATREGATRLYILSDDNDNPRQRTLLLAFDVISDR
ncbi:MAG: esterase-like activity of phytase family protein [Pseudomonadota bacterium]|nr:esterase-like activity of phytase family protein [Pseudomonadota bacterium]